jgi:hypothetical protein
MVEIMENAQLPVLQQPKEAPAQMQVSDFNDPARLSEEILRRANEVERARADLANINLVGARAIDSIDANFTDILKTKRTEVDSQFNVLNEVLTNKTKAAGLPNFVTRVLGFFDDDYNMTKQELKAQGAQTKLQQISNDVSTVDAIRKTNISRVGTILDAAKTNFSQAATSAQGLRESASTIFAAQDQAFQRTLRGVQSAPDDVLQAAIKTPNANLPAGLAQAEIVRRAEQRERLTQLKIETGVKGLEARQKVQEDFLNNMTTAEIEHLMQKSKEDKVAGGVMLADGKTFLSDAALIKQHNIQKKKEEEFTTRAVQEAQVPVRTEMAKRQLDILGKVPGAVDTKLIADAGALEARIVAAQKVGNTPEMVSGAEALTKLIQDRQDAFIKSLPEEKKKLYENYFNNGGFVNDSVAAVPAIAALSVNRDALAGTILSPVYQQFSDLVNTINQENFRFNIPSKGAGPMSAIPLNKMPSEAVISRALREKIEGKTITDHVGGYVFKDASLMALETLAQQDVLKDQIPGGPTSSPFKDILDKQKFYKFDGKKLSFSMQGLVHELEAKTDELRRAGVLDAGTSLTDIFTRTLMTPEFMQSYDDKYIKALSPEAQAFNALAVPGGRPSVLLGTYATQEIPKAQLAIRQMIAEQTSQAEQQLQAATAMQDQITKQTNGGAKARVGNPGRTMAQPPPEQLQATIEQLKQDNQPAAVFDRIRQMLGTYVP